jgi:hypothetical protein
MTSVVRMLPVVIVLELAAFAAQPAEAQELEPRAYRTLPTGQYSPSYIINFGANRWGFKPEVGYLSVKGNWIFEFAAGVWLFMANSSGMGGTTIRQDPITSLQAHLSYNMSHGIWLGLDANYFEGADHDRRAAGERYPGELARRIDPVAPDTAEALS